MTLDAATGQTAARCGTNPTAETDAAARTTAIGTATGTLIVAAIATAQMTAQTTVVAGSEIALVRPIEDRETATLIETDRRAGGGTAHDTSTTETAGIDVETTVTRMRLDIAATTTGTDEVRLTHTQPQALLAQRN